MLCVLDYLCSLVSLRGAVVRPSLIGGSLWTSQLYAFLNPRSKRGFLRKQEIRASAAHDGKNTEYCETLYPYPPLRSISRCLCLKKDPDFFLHTVKNAKREE